MDTIKFCQKEYGKLIPIDIKNPITLLEIFTKEKKELSKEFVKYETQYRDKKGDLKTDWLANGLTLILLFQDNLNRLFTTCRPYNRNKEEYFNNKRGECFQIEWIPEPEPTVEELDLF